MPNKIMLNDILCLGDLENVKIRLNKTNDKNVNPIDLFKRGEVDSLLKWQYWNSNNKRFREGELTVGLVRLSGDLWLLFHVGRVTKDLNKSYGVGYEHEVANEFEKYFGRLIVKYKNTTTNMVRIAKELIGQCEVVQILPDVFGDDVFPGYENVNISWSELKNVLGKEGWKTALQNQKGVYLITDTSNGKRYVGSAYGDRMLLGRWKSYVKSRHGGNKGLMELDPSHIEENFRYSILDIFKSTIDDAVIRSRESWWKQVLLTRDARFGYNKN